MLINSFDWSGAFSNQIPGMRNNHKAFIGLNNEAEAR
ncbi:MAG: hypothetical protein JWQ71_104 [Pedosphaera sp.]|nr:hypothetical protein [Pedosphaera sp.]